MTEKQFIFLVAYFHVNCIENLTILAVYFKLKLDYSTGNGDSAVDIATGYGIDDQRVVVRIPLGSRVFIPPCRSDWHWGPPRHWGPPKLL
jgi:hypothetical protein